LLGIVAIEKKVKSFRINDNGLASQADYMIISGKGNVLTIPENINYKQVVASIEGVHFANNFMKKVDLKAGQEILINVVSGVIGSVL